MRISLQRSDHGENSSFTGHIHPRNAPENVTPFLISLAIPCPPPRGAPGRAAAHFGGDPWRGRPTLAEIRGVAGALCPRSVAWPAHFGRDPWRGRRTGCGAAGSHRSPGTPPECMKVHCAPSRHHQITVFARVYKGFADFLFAQHYLQHNYALRISFSPPPQTPRRNLLTKADTRQKQIGL